MVRSALYVPSLCPDAISRKIAYCSAAGLKLLRQGADGAGPDGLWMGRGITVRRGLGSASQLT